MSTLEQELPATLDERQQNVVQMQKIELLTIEPGVMRLPVKRVTSAENSPQWAIDLKHPIEGELRFFVKKPTDGWHNDQEFVKLLHWYGILDGNPYKLQEHHLYVRKSEDAERNHGWELINPDYREENRLTKKEKAYERVRKTRTKLPDRTIGLAYAAHLVIPFILMFLISMAELSMSDAFALTVIGVMGFIGTTLVTVMFTEPDNAD